MAKTKLLIVDDDPNACETLSDIFQEKGYSVEAASTGKEAIDKAKTTGFNAALIDIKLPDMDGTALLKKFKSMHPELVCIIITGHAALQNAINALKEGASGYFVKPLVIDEVALRVEEALDKQHLQQELKESENKYRNLYESSIDGIVSCDMQGNLLNVNKAFLDMFGYTLIETRKLSYQKLTPKKWQKQDEDVVKNQILKRGYSDEYEKEYLRKDGTVFPASLRLWLINDKYEKPMGIWGIVRDITERKHAEMALRAAAKEWQTTFDAISDAVCKLSKDGKILRCNDSMEKLVGKPEDQIIGRLCCELIHGSPVPLDGCPFTNMLKTRKRSSLEVLLGDKYFEVTVEPMLDENDEINGGVHIISDITERKKTEKELKEHREHLEEMIQERTTELQKTINLMAGREVRMTELKEAIKKLRKQIESAGLTPVVDDPLKETVTD